MDAAKMQAVKVSTVSCCVASEAEVTDAEGSAQASLGSPRFQTCLQSQVGGISDRNHEEHQGDAKHVDSAASGCDPVNTWGNRVLPGWGCAAARLEMCCNTTDHPLFCLCGCHSWRFVLGNKCRTKGFRH